jgi:hypothetical protein
MVVEGILTTRPQRWSRAHISFQIAIFKNFKMYPSEFLTDIALAPFFAGK